MSNKRKKIKTIETSEIAQKNGKEKKLFDNLLRTVQQLVKGKSYVPLSLAELMNKLHLPEQHTEILRETLNELLKLGMVEFAKGRYSFKETAENLVRGILRLHPRGFGFVKPENSALNVPDIFIPKHLTNNAVDGDTVDILVNEESVSEKGPEGKVVTIVSRAHENIAGIVIELRKDQTYIAYAPMLGMAQKIIVETDQHTTLKAGDRIVMQVIEWGGKGSNTISKFLRLLGNIADASKDIPAAIEEFNLRKDFPENALEEARQYGKQVPLKEIRNREDLRHLTCFTIDPDTAKDFDDAISLTKDEKGHYHLGVHIADVSFYVKPGSFLDLEAQLRCNSTYFPGYCLPMLPRELSDNLCSLKADVNRLTGSVLMEFDAMGNLVNYRMTRSVIKSCKRFTYKDAKAILDEKKKSVHLDALKLMVEMCGLLKKKRYERGSIEFGLPELVVLVDKEGMPSGTDYVVYDITHQLVEEFMLKANETVAWHLSNQGKNLTYRIHDEPAEENMKDFSILAGAFGFHLSATPSPRDIQKLFDEAMETSYGQYLATSYIRRMRLALYSAENIGHYGLSLTHYCHFTSPIRRYVDLVVHRILFDQPEDKEKLIMICERCSEQERISAKAENSVSLLKKLRLLDLNKKADPKKQYDAIVTRVKNFGIYFEIIELMLEGYLHVSELENDYYLYDEETMALKGRRYGEVYKAGDKMTVMLTDVDFVTLESKWNLVPETKPQNERENERQFSVETSYYKDSKDKASKSRKDFKSPNEFDSSRSNQKKNDKKRNDKKNTDKKFGSKKSTHKKSNDKNHKSSGPSEYKATESVPFDTFIKKKMAENKSKDKPKFEKSSERKQEDKQLTRLPVPKGRAQTYMEMTSSPAKSKRKK